MKKGISFVGTLIFIATVVIVLLIPSLMIYSAISEDSRLKDFCVDRGYSGYTYIGIADQSVCWKIENGIVLTRQMKTIEGKVYWLKDDIP